jgi:hypothetical protein
MKEGLNYMILYGVVERLWRSFGRHLSVGKSSDEKMLLQ